MLLLLIATTMLAVPRPRDSLDGVRPCLGRAGDVDGDGVGDLWIASRRADRARRLWVLSGTDGDLLLAVSRDDGYRVFADSAAAAGDLDGDGFGDLLVGCSAPLPDPQPGRGLSRIGAEVVSGRTGETLMRLETDPLPAGQAREVVGGTDLDCDGHPDLVVGAPVRDGEGRGSVLVFSGDGGALLRRIRAPSGLDGEPQARSHGFGTSLCLVPDIDGDGTAEIACGDPSRGMRSDRSARGAVTLLSGRSGEVLWTVRGAPLHASPDGLGWLVRPAGDFDGDGKVDVLATQLDTTLRILAGGDGRVLLDLDLRSHALFSTGSSADVLADLDGDRVPEVLVAANESDCMGEVFQDGSFWWVRSSRTGEALFASRDLDRGEAERERYDVCALGDVDRDGRDELAVALVATRRVRVLSGAEASVRWDVELDGLPDRAAPRADTRPRAR